MVQIDIDKGLRYLGLNQTQAPLFSTHDPKWKKQVFLFVI